MKKLSSYFAMLVLGIILGYVFTPTSDTSTIESATQAEDPNSLKAHYSTLIEPTKYMEAEYHHTSDLNCTLIGKSEGVDYTTNLQIALRDLDSSKPKMAISATNDFTNFIEMKVLRETSKAVVMQYIAGSGEATLVTLTKKSGYINMVSTSVENEFGSIGSGYCGPTSAK